MIMKECFFALVASLFGLCGLEVILAFRKLDTSEKSKLMKIFERCIDVLLALIAMISLIALLYSISKKW